MSKQNLIDCTAYLGNHGCGGGAFQYAFEYVRGVGINSAAAYPYTGKNGACKYSAASSVTKAKTFQSVQPNSEPALQQATALVGPISIGINAGLSSFQMYKSGVYAPTGCSTTKIDHSVLVIGYGTSAAGQGYWLIQNSWGTTWGQQGYMMLARNANNMCGVSTDAAFPLI